MQLQNAATAKTNRVWQFFALTYALTWIFWIPLALSGQDVMAGPLMIPLLLGGFGPSIAGIIMTYRTQDREGRRDPGPAGCNRDLHPSWRPGSTAGQSRLTRKGAERLSAQALGLRRSDGERLRSCT
jgi:hypothetical protein